MTYLTYFRLLCGSSILVLLVAKLQVIVDGVRASTVPADYLVGTRSYGSLRSVVARSSLQTQLGTADQ